MTPSETAASRLADYMHAVDRNHPDVTDDDRSESVGIICDFLTAVVACPQCEGTGIVDGYVGMEAAGFTRAGVACPAEHVEMDLFGETICANPAQVIATACPAGWGCNNLGYERYMSDDEIAACRASHTYEPRMSAILAALEET